MPFWNSALSRRFLALGLQSCHTGRLSQPGMQLSHSLHVTMAGWLAVARLLLLNWDSEIYPSQVNVLNDNRIVDYTTRHCSRHITGAPYFGCLLWFIGKRQDKSSCNDMQANIVNPRGKVELEEACFRRRPLLFSLFHFPSLTHPLGPRALSHTPERRKHTLRPMSGGWATGHTGWSKGEETETVSVCARRQCLPSSCIVPGSDPDRNQ